MSSFVVLLFCCFWGFDEKRLAKTTILAALVQVVTSSPVDASSVQSTVAANDAASSAIFGDDYEHGFWLYSGGGVLLCVTRRHYPFERVRSEQSLTSTTRQTWRVL